MFAKVFEQIFDSSIADNWQVRHVFEDLLKLADINGVVDRTHEAIARRTGIPLDIITVSIAELEKPDPRSRSKEYEGRRLIRLDDHRNWGWVIVNYQYYRNLASESQRRERTRDRVSRFRSSQKPLFEDTVVTHGNAPVTESNANFYMQREREMNMESTPLPPDVLEDRRVRLNAMFRRRDETRWDQREVSAFMGTAALADEGDFKLVEDYYRSDHPHRRRDLKTLLNNWNGELDRARAWDRSGRRAPSNGNTTHTNQQRQDCNTRNPQDYSTAPNIIRAGAAVQNIRRSSSGGSSPNSGTVPV